MALRDDSFKLLPLLSYTDALKKVIPYADVLNGNFKSLMDTHVTSPWLRSWLNALAFSLSGLPAAETGKYRTDVTPPLSMSSLYVGIVLLTHTHTHTHTRPHTHLFTGAAALAYTIFDLHRPGASLGWCYQ